jgi:hypothetical protein
LDLYGRYASDDGSKLIGRRSRGRWRRGVAFLIGLAALGSGLSACGGGAALPGVASAGSSSTTSTVAPADAPSSSASLYRDELKYAQCMRAHGVPNFPDPSSGGGFRLGAGVDPTPAALAKCQGLLPAGGGLPGGGPAPTAEALAEMLKVSQCMRRHGISNFPDPRTSIPANRAEVGDIADRDGVILIFPPGFDEHSPQFTRAAAACGFQLTNH